MMFYVLICVRHVSSCFVCCVYHVHVVIQVWLCCFVCCSCLCVFDCCPPPALFYLLSLLSICCLLACYSVYVCSALLCFNLCFCYVWFSVILGLCAFIGRLSLEFYTKQIGPKLALESVPRGRNIIFYVMFLFIAA